MNFSFVTILCALGILKTTAQEPNFCHSNFGVWFDPYVSVTDVGKLHRYNVDGLIPIISKIATKFNKLMMIYYPTTLNLDLYTPALIPAAVATYNKFHRTPHQQPLELIITFTLTVPGDGSVQTNFDIVQELADNANSIFPGTVKRLFFLNRLREAVFTDTKIYLEYINRVANHSEYILGADLLLSDCGSFSKTLPNYISTILPNFKEILLTYYPYTQDLPYGPVETAEYFTKLFEYNVQKLKRQGGNVAVGFRTVWEGISQDGFVQNSLHLVQYWKLMNKFSIASNRLAILAEAFDTPHRAKGYKRQGWWKLVENASYLNSSEYVYEEKWKVVEHLLAADEIEMDDVVNSTTSLPELSTSSELVTVSTEPTTPLPEKPTIVLMHNRTFSGELKLDENTTVTLNSSDDAVNPSRFPNVSTILIKVIVIAVALLLLILSVMVLRHVYKSLHQVNPGSEYNQIVFSS